ncbi:MAG: Fur family transcriptional regulator [Pseudomonadota bacterium]
MSRVMQLCQERHLRLTALRQQVLELLWQSARPMGAYELINGLGIKSSRAVAPPTVYRTLDFLVTQGFAAKIESRNAYVPCAHPERCHEPIFLICGDCEEWVELDDLRFEQQLAEQAAHAGFRATGRVVEVLGTCVDCSA